MDDVDTLLARFPGPVTIPPSRIKLAVALVLLAGLTVFSVHLLLDAIEAWSSNVIRASLALLVCGILAVLSAIQLLPGASGLILDAGGFERRRWYRRARWSWRDVGGFRISATDDLEPILFDIAGPAPGAPRHGALPTNYRVAGRDLVRLLNDWRTRALAQPQPHPTSVPQAGDARSF
jgi:hypothetical protein